VVFKPQFIPRERKFFGLFEKSAENTSQAAVKFKGLVDLWSDVPERVREITELEQYGDTITHDIMNLLNHTFVTPFDREDIALLAHTLDDVTDCIQAAADFMLIYKVKAQYEKARELADIIVQITVELERAIPKLHDHRGELKKILNYRVEINRLENVADQVYRSALAELFDNITDIIEVIKWREIYEQMEIATDRCEDVADILEGLALKNG
jgi:predicted phosphate transport protein (TIGR00153 family)